MQNTHHYKNAFIARRYSYWHDLTFFLSISGQIMIIDISRLELSRSLRTHLTKKIS